MRRFFRMAHRAVATWEIDLRSKSRVRIETRFCDRDREAAFAAVVRTFHKPGADQIAHRVLDSDFVGKIDPGRGTELFAMTNFKKARATELVPHVADENDFVSVV